MADSTGNNPKILKLIGVFIVVFFLLIIVFNIWMKASMDKDKASSGLKAVSGTRLEERDPSPVKPVAAKQIIEIEKPSEVQPAGEQRLILQ
ncbi:MAG: hypothetical protein FJZ10_00760 [Candidatus Omnitrophica bacterium]|nr:hypothetical protein [Candidatus Omnitrophota bacterium]